MGEVEPRISRIHPDQENRGPLGPPATYLPAIWPLPSFVPPRAGISVRWASSVEMGEIRCSRWNLTFVIR